MSTEDDELNLIEDEIVELSDVPVLPKKKPWKMLIVDDEPEIHVVTKLALDDFSFAGRELEYMHAYSGAEAKTMIESNPDTAVILLDVVMETDHAGLEVARYVRQELGNHFVRIILRTGQPGVAPEKRVLKVYDINDYRAKTELTQERMFSVVYTALSSYRDLMALARSRRQMSAMINELEQFTSVATEFIRKPSVKLVSNALMLQGHIGENLDDTAQTCMRNILQANDALQAAIQDLSGLLKVTRMSESRVRTEFESVVKTACEHLKPTIAEKEADVTWGDLPAMIVAKDGIEILFEKLILNGLQYQRGPGGSVHIDATLRGREWLFAVTDNGMGISPEFQETVFSIQGGAARAPYSTGGIGLAICDKIVRWHGGKIWMESDVGRGCTVFFTLPLDDD